MTFIQKLARTTRDVSAMGPGFLFARLTPRRRGGAVRFAVKGVGRIHARPRSGDVSIVRQIFGERQYDLSSFKQNAAIESRYRALLAEGARPVIIDAGANIGMSSIWFAQRFPEADVVAIEPDPGNAAICRLNVAAFPNVTVREAAIGSTAGQVTLSVDGRKACAVETVRGEAGGVEVITVEAARPTAASRLFIVKVDIEGFEEDLFSANLGWIEEADVVIVEPHDWLFPDRSTSATFQAAMAAGGFQVLILGENLVYVRRPGA